jgi:DNA damage-binding protein 1
VLSVSGTNQRKLNCVSSLTVAGSVHDLGYVELHGGRLIAGINSTVQALKWNGTSLAFTSTVSFTGLIACVSLNVVESEIIVGDLMNSLVVLGFSCVDGVDDLVVSAKDANNVWVASVGVVDDVILCADGDLNLVMFARDKDKLDVVGRWHLGEYVNRFRTGSIGREDEGGVGKVMGMFCTVGGGIGVVCSVGEYAPLLLALQERMRKYVTSIGGLDHQAWRAWKNERRVEDGFGVIDGGIVEGFLGMGVEERRVVCEGLVVDGVGVGEGRVCEVVEGLSRLH